MNNRNNNNRTNDLRTLIETNRQLVEQVGNLVETNRELLSLYIRACSGSHGYTPYGYTHHSRNETPLQNNTDYSNMYNSYYRTPTSAYEQPYQNRRENTNTNTNANINTNANTNANMNMYTNYSEPTYYTATSYPRTTRQLNTNSTTDRIAQTLRDFLDPVNICPTAAQIENATRRTRYCDIVSPRNLTCPINLDTFRDTDFVSVIRYCGHIFNTDALNTWFLTNCRCPVCRYDIRNYVRPISSNEPANNNDSSTSETNPIQTNHTTQTPIARLGNIVGNLLTSNVDQLDTNLEDFIQEITSYDLSGNFTTTTPTTIFRVLYDIQRGV